MPISTRARGATFWGFNPAWLIYLSIIGFCVVLLLSLPGGDIQLVVAARQGNLPAVEHLVARGANLNRRVGPLQQTALMVAALNGHEKAVALLLRSGARRDLTDGSGRTALELAVGNCRSNVVLLLRSNP